MNFSSLNLLLLLFSFVFFACGGDAESTADAPAQAKPQKGQQAKKPAKKPVKLLPFQVRNPLTGKKQAKTNAAVSVDNINNKPYKSGTIAMVSDGGKEVLIRGWAFDKAANKPAKEVYLRANGKFFKGTYGVQRDDVASNMNNPQLGKTGFVVKVPRQALKNGKNTIDVIVMNNRGNEFFPVIPKGVIKINL